MWRLEQEEEYERASETADDVGDDCGEPRFFQIICAYGTPGDEGCAGSSGRRRDCADGSGLEVRRGETRQEAAKCAALFAKHREAMDGVVVTLPNFGDERAMPIRCG